MMEIEKDIKNVQVEIYQEKAVNNYEIMVKEDNNHQIFTLFNDKDMYSSLPPVLQSKEKLERKAVTKSKKILKKLFKYEEPK